MRTRNITPEMFKDIAFRQKSIPGSSVSKYRVYSDYKNYTVVEAENAQGALETSGVKNPVRVLRDSIYLDKVLLVNTLKDAQPTLPAVASDSVLPAVATTDAALSNEDVSKLLNY